MLDTLLVPINRAGWPFVGIFAAGAVIMAHVSEPLGWVGAVLTTWCAYFFRDPARVVPVREGLVVSPADGVVQLVDEALPPPELGIEGGPRPRVCVFMNVFNVHVNRIPCGGRVSGLAYRPGRFLNASLDKASELNERQSVRLSLPGGADIALVQIAGLIARRIVCQIKENQTMRTGERFGLIRFGSRVDVYLPAGTAPLVAVGQRAVAGETVIADLTANEPARTGEVR